MFDWLKKLLPSPPRPTRSPPTADEALVALRQMMSNAAIEDVWDGLDLHAETLRSRIREHVVEQKLGRYPMHAAVLWLCYREGNAGRLADDELVSRLRESVVWALGFEENQVLIGGALGALDALGPSEREAMALEVFDELGEESVRRYWLLLKVRTDAFVARVADALENYDPDRRAKMAGAFRQMTSDDVDVLLKHHTLESPGAAMFVEALAATRAEKARPALEEALDDSRPDVRDAARRGLSALDREFQNPS